jgi:Big-like domain-containing protein
MSRDSRYHSRASQPAAARQNHIFQDRRKWPMPKPSYLLATLSLLAAGTTCSEPVPTGPLQPPALRIFSGNHSIGLMLGDSLPLGVTLTGAHGEIVPIPPSFTLVSRDPSVIAMNGTFVMHANTMGDTWVVGSVEFEGQRLADSVEVSVACTLELGWSLTPTQQTLHVGDSFTPSVTFMTCGGRLHPVDTLRWSASDTAIVRVDSITGRTTGRSPGQATVQFRAARFHVTGGLPVTVIAPSP